MSTELLPYTFKWNGDANSVIITGSFDNWSKSTILSKANESSSEFLGTVLLPIDKPVYFKNNGFLFVDMAAFESERLNYVIDGNWTTSNNYKVDTDASGNENNFLSVEDLETFKVENKSLKAKSNSSQLSTDTLTLDKNGTAIPSNATPDAIIASSRTEHHNGKKSVANPKETVSQNFEKIDDSKDTVDLSKKDNTDTSNKTQPIDSQPFETLTDTSSYHELTSNFSMIDESGEKKLQGAATSSNAESSFVPVKKDDKSVTESSNFSNIEKSSPAVKSIKSSMFDEHNNDATNDESIANIGSTQRSYTPITGEDVPTTATADITATRTPPERSTASIVVVNNVSKTSGTPPPPPVISKETSTIITTTTADGKNAANVKNNVSRNALNSLHLDDLESDASFKSISSNEMFSSTRESFESENGGVGSSCFNSKKKPVGTDNNSINNSPSMKINNGNYAAGPTANNGNGEHKFSLHYGNHSGSSHSLLSKFKRFFR